VTGVQTCALPISPVVDLPSMTMGIQPCDRERQLEPRRIA
jgi:hypothetical protein